MIDPCAGSGSTLIAAQNLKRRGYGFEIKKDFYKSASRWILENEQNIKDIEEFGFAKTAISSQSPILF